MMNEGGSLTNVIGVLIRGEDTQTEEFSVKTEAETGVMLPQTKMPAATRSRKRPRKDLPLEAWVGTRPCQHLGLGLLASRTIKT